MCVKTQKPRQQIVKRTPKRYEKSKPKKQSPELNTFYKLPKIWQQMQ